MESVGQKNSADIDFMKNFFYRLNEQREAEWHTDFVLRKGEMFIPCHKVVIRARTGIFQRQEDLDSYEITSNVPDSIIPELVSYIYTFEIDMTSHSVPHLVELAEELMLDDLSQLCDECLAKLDISEENCFDLYRFSRKHEFSQFKNRIQEFLLKSFDFLSTDPRFLDLEIDAVIEIIQSDDLNVTDERRVLDAARRWIEASEDRLMVGEDILSHVRLAMINIQFDEYLRMRQQQKIFLPHNASMILDSAMRFLTSPASRWELSTPSTRPRKYQFVRECLLVVVKSTEKLSFICHNAKSSSWAVLPSNSSQQQNFGYGFNGNSAVSVNNSAFHASQAYQFQQPKVYPHSPFAFQPTSTQPGPWVGASVIQPPNTNFHNNLSFCSAVHDNLLFTLSSNTCTVFNILMRNTSNSVDYLTLQERFSAAVDFPTHGLVAVTIPEHICLLGPVCKKLVISYGTFQDFPAPELTVADACAFYANNKIYLLGGKIVDGNGTTENRIVQIYDFENGTWICLTEVDLPDNERILSAACFEGRIFVLCSSGSIYTFDSTTANMKGFAELKCSPLRSASMCAYQNQLHVTCWTTGGAVLLSLNLSTREASRINSEIDMHNSCCSANSSNIASASASSAFHSQFNGYPNNSENCDRCQRTNVSQCFPLILR